MKTPNLYSKYQEEQDEALAHHYRTCLEIGAARLRIVCAAEIIHGFLAPRIVTIIVFATALLGASIFW